MCCYRNLIVLSLFISPLFLLSSPAVAGQNTLAADLGVQVYPAAGQDASQQSIDEADCYQWAVQNTGNDPFALEDVAEQQQQQTATAQQQAAQTGAGSGLRGAARGAAVGALIAEVSDGDTDEGALAGAVAGGLRGRRSGAQQQAQAQQQVEQQRQQQEQQLASQRERFSKAFGACLEGKDYVAR